jgi:hypothetical protein
MSTTETLVALAVAVLLGGVLLRQDADDAAFWFRWMRWRRRDVLAAFVVAAVVFVYVGGSGNAQTVLDAIREAVR